ncbi:hypothetical protein NLM33_43285 [Bradyrhizobium sp. CCGUVB1N3]|uniref:hypothetical protein n=1 Tax=Bradyrhizobium sp. CCGUVB1N3 TaxID=2949629 RepID=UPI0020B1D0CB|nr:hypothetical protein [Bradyrhizobium sp. CCGUVB1N3]MCP3476985.1 hypothetical protein [Bradyrhizobium sp. CCGUVB1N3]
MDIRDRTAAARRSLVSVNWASQNASSRIAIVFDLFTGLPVSFLRLGLGIMSMQ